MKLFKACALVTLAAVLSLACSSSGGENKNANTSQGMVILPSNTNVSAPSDSTNANKAAPATPATPPSRINAAALYTAQKCTGCHGLDGKGKVKGAPNFDDAAWQQTATDAKLVEAIKKGNVPKMPAYESKLSEDQIRALVAYVRTFSGK